MDYNDTNATIGNITIGNITLDNNVTKQDESLCSEKFPEMDIYLEGKLNIKQTNT